MTESNRQQNQPSRWSRFLTAFRTWLPGRKTRQQIANRGKQSDRRKTNPPRLGMESLEERTTISEAVFGLVWPSLWAATSPATDASKVGGAGVSFALQTPRPVVTPFAAQPAGTGEISPVSAASSHPEFSGSTPRPAASWLGDPWSRPALFGIESTPTGRQRIAVSLPALAAAPLGPVQTSSPVFGGAGGLSSTSVYAGFGAAAVGEASDLLVTLVAARPLGEPPEVQGPAFQVSWQAGGYDGSGQYMGGTELMNLVAHQGVLFAATGVRDDVPGLDPRVGAQILRLDEPQGDWQVDHHFAEILPEGNVRYVRVEALRSVTFTTDGEGKPLPKAVPMLMASVSDETGRVAVFSRDDVTGAWTEMVLQESAERAWIRTLGFHQDRVTGIDRVFAGIRGIGTFSGVYDASAVGGIRWDKEPELIHSSRVVSFTEANGELHLLAKPYLFQRIDGPQPQWKLVLEVEDQGPLVEGLRTLKAIPAQSGEGEEFLAGIEGPNAEITHILPQEGYAQVSELHLQTFLRQQWGGLLAPSVTPGYNDLIEVVEPGTQETALLIGLDAHPPLSLIRSSWYLVRHADASYDLHQIVPLPHPTIPNPFLFATRTILVSPFAEDQGQVVYFGGYDTYFLRAHNTAWLYKASLETVLS